MQVTANSSLNPSSIPTHSRSTERFALFLAASIYSLTLTYPFNNDNALYAYMADLLLHGRLPYIGSWDQNFPAVILVHIVPILIGLRSQFVFHVWDILLQLSGSLIAFRLLERHFNARAAFIGVTLLALYYIQAGLWMAGERDTYAGILLLGLLYLIGKERLSNKIFFYAGLLAGAIVLFRPTYGLYGVILVGWSLIYKAPDLSTRLKTVALTILGCILPSILVAITYAIAGGLDQLWSAVITFNFKVYGGHGEQFSLWEPIRFYWVSIPFAVFGGCLLWKKGAKSLLTIWSLFFVASVISLIVLYRHSVYHYYPAMMLFILMSAGGWERAIQLITEMLSKSVKLRLAISRAGIFLLLFFFLAQTLRGNTVHLVIHELLHGKIHSMRQLYAFYEGSTDFGVPVQMEVGDYLKQHTTPGDTVQMFGPYSSPQYFARLTTASRFQTAHAILMRGSGDTLQPFQRKWREEYLADMIRNRPLYFIVCDAPEAFRQYYGGMLGHEVLNKDFTELRDWLQTHYISETRIGAFTLYRRMF